MDSIASHPIGIFDSGIGGLTLVNAITSILPDENIIYFGDTAHLPYGDKSAAAIQAYSIKICNLLLERKCKLILIACNSASSAAYELVAEYVGNKAIVLNVIDPVVSYVAKHFPNKKIGLIGTKQTVSSNVYQKKIDEYNNGIQLLGLATPLLAPMIEEGFFNGKITIDIIKAYLSSESLENIAALVLGCTHYPLIKKEIESFYNGKVEVIDGSNIVAEELKLVLSKKNLLNKNERKLFQFFISDYTDSFAKSAQLFLRTKIDLEFYPLW